MPERNIFDRRGIPTVINAAGTLTRLSGGIVAPGVAEAMRDACLASVDMLELQAHASQILAAITGAEAGYVTAGASAGLLLATAACLSRYDASLMNRLPDTGGMSNEFVIPRGHRNGYDHAVRAAGGRLVEAGLPERQAGVGVRETEAWEIGAAINERTAAVLYVAGEWARPALAEVTEIAHRASVPVIVDAAAELPPQSNLRHFLAQGADLVVFSGGKALGGPAASGILCGRRNLVMSAVVQSIDLDVTWDQWNPPTALVDKKSLTGLPQQGVGRSCKVGKQEIMGLLAAIEHFVAEGDEARHSRWLVDARRIADGLADQDAATVTLVGESDVSCIPRVELQFPRGSTSAALALAERLLDGDRPIHLDQTWSDRGRLIVNPICLRDGEARLVAQNVVRILRQ